MKKLIATTVIACLLMAFASFTASAQSPVSWKAGVEMKSATEGVVTLTATMEEGWHIYGTKMPDDGPIATSLKFITKGVKFDGNVKVNPAPTKEMDNVFGIEVSYWEGKVVFSRKFEVTSPSQAEITMEVRYMTCNDSSCRPPVTEKLTVKID